MLRLLIDENFDQRVLRGLRLRLPELDFTVVQETDLKGLEDPVVLEGAAIEGRIVVTHDINTLPGYAYDRIRAGQPMSGVIIVPEELAIGTAIEELLLAVECWEPADLENTIQYLPL